MLRYAIFGGTGFIGTHLSQALLEADRTCQITLVDIRPPRVETYTQALIKSLEIGQTRYIHHDLRSPIDASTIGSVDVIFNLAAIHREPGHLPHEYFETNLRAAEHVCAYASEVNAKSMVFTSSIAVYGSTEQPKTERSLTVPETPYGSSKLAAEYIHRAWSTGDPGRKLLIMRPGVVFGPGEGGNVSRLIKSLLKGYFVFVGNRKTRKAGGYVKELCQVILFGLGHQSKVDEHLNILNFSSSPTASLEEFVDTVRRVAGIPREPISLPRSVVMGLTHVIHGITFTCGLNQPISPTRVRKLFRSTNIEAEQLSRMGYVYHYSLEAAFEDWKASMPSDFIVGSSHTASSLKGESATIATGAGPTLQTSLDRSRVV